jgi:pimeloyl-ACP methyl ester carboxylesterase
MLRRTLLSLAAALVAALSVPALAQEAQMQLPAPTKSGYAPVNGVEIYYAMYGKGDPLVLLHGGYGQIEMFAPVLAALAENHTVIGVDLQAHGRTLPMDRPMSFDAMATDVAELIKFLGYEKSDILGYSLGGTVALRVALDHPDVVDKLVLTSIPYAFSGWHDYNQQGMRAMTDIDATVAGLKMSPLGQAYEAVAPDPNNFRKLVEKMAALMGKDYDFSSEIGNVKAPTMLVYADWDAVRTSHAAKFFELLGGGQHDANWDRSLMGQNRLAILPNASHYDILMSPLYVPAVTGFIDAK